MKHLISLTIVAMMVLPALAAAQEEPCPGEATPIRPVIERSKERFHTVKKAKKSARRTSARKRK
jgi:hypothetical protein